jgi:hypothetical protein
VTTDTITINRQQAIDLMREVAEGREDYVYDSNIGCDYVRDGAPSCLVGQALHRAGVPVERFAPVEGDAPHSVGVVLERNELDEPVRRGTFAEALGVEMDDGAVRVLSEAQAHQDSGVPWGKAIDVAVAETADVELVAA